MTVIVRVRRPFFVVVVEGSVVYGSVATVQVSGSRAFVGESQVGLWRVGGKGVPVSPGSCLERPEWKLRVRECLTKPWVLSPVPRQGLGQEVPVGSKPYVGGGVRR